MCMITYIPSGIAIPWDGIRNGSKTNQDGHGWAIASSDGLQVGKSMKFAEAEETLREAIASHARDAQVVFHSRFGTHGVMGEFNIHPFPIGDHTIVAHNGVLPHTFWPDLRDPRSDTRIFVDRMLSGYEGVPSRRMGGRLGQQIGLGNKLAFLSIASGRPRARIVNRFLGVDTGGVWYSNTGYKPHVTRNWLGSPGWDSKGWQWETPGESKEVVRWQPQPAKEWGYEDEEACPMCKSVVNFDIIAGWCYGCERCSDCKQGIEGCLCYVPDHSDPLGADHVV